MRSEKRSGDSNETSEEEEEEEDDRQQRQQRRQPLREGQERPEPGRNLQRRTTAPSSELRESKKKKREIGTHTHIRAHTCHHRNFLTENFRRNQFFCSYLFIY